MAKIDEIKEILNTLRIAMSLVAGIIIVLFGKLFDKFDVKEFDTMFWAIFVTIIVMLFIEGLVVYSISKKTKEIKDL